MLAHTDTTVPDPAADAPRPPAYGTPSPALLARADRGLGRFLDRADTGAAGTAHSVGDGPGATG